MPGLAIAQTEREILNWDQLPDLPVDGGLDGLYVGTHNGALIVAGGVTPSKDLTGVNQTLLWHDDVYILEPGDIDWRSGFKLNRLLAYGAAVSTQVGLILIGGVDNGQPVDAVTQLRWDASAKALHQEVLPTLPRPGAMLAAVEAGDKLYVAAGPVADNMDAFDQAFWTLDLSDLESGWQPSGTWPGPVRINAVATVQSGGSNQSYVYFFDGVVPPQQSDSTLAVQLLRDAYRFNPDPTPGEAPWRQIVDLPHTTVARAAVSVGQSHILVFGDKADTGLESVESGHVSGEIWGYHTITDTWTRVGSMLEEVSVAAAVVWQGRIVIKGEGAPVYTVEIRPPAVGFGIVNYLVLGVYLVVLVGMGVYFARRETSTDDFFLAGRRIPWWAAGLSIYATQLSAITFISTPAVSYATDWLVYPSTWMILLMAPVVTVFFLPFFRRLNITTAYEYLERRFNTAVRLFGSASFILFQLGRMAIIVYLPALALTAIAGINIYVCIFLMGFLAILYTVLGGMEAVIWTDVIQTVVLLGGMIIGLTIILVHEGGIGTVYESAQAQAKLTLFNASWSVTELTTWSIVLGSFFLQFGPYTTDQSVIQRYLTTSDEKAAARGIWLNGLLAIPGTFLFFALGTALFVFFQNNPDLLTVGMENDQVFPLFIARQLPAGLSGLVIAGIFAASMSSLDSSMHSIATAVTTDFYRRFKPDASDQQSLRLARVIVIVIGLVGVATASALATFDIKSLFLFFQSVLGLLSSGLVGIFILGIFTRRAHAAGVLTGAVVATALLVYITQFTTIHFYLYAVIGISVCVVVGYITSLVFTYAGKDLTGLTLHS